MVLCGSPGLVADHNSPLSHSVSHDHCYYFGNLYFSFVLILCMYNLSAVEYYYVRINLLTMDFFLTSDSDSKLN